jgi:hypothetical protein
MLAQYQAGAFTQNRDVMEQLYLLQKMSESFKASKDANFSKEIDDTLKLYTNKLKAI